MFGQQQLDGHHSSNKRSSMDLIDFSIFSFCLFISLSF